MSGNTWLLTWLCFVMVLVTMAIVVWLNLAAAPNQTLHTACDHVVERLLTTHDPVELERSRILVSQIDCDVSWRLERWPAARTGNLTP